MIYVNSVSNRWCGLERLGHKFEGKKIIQERKGLPPAARLAIPLFKPLVNFLRRSLICL
jgi:hypothetical protein